MYYEKNKNLKSKNQELFRIINKIRKHILSCYLNAIIIPMQKHKRAGIILSIKFKIQVNLM